jgi:hypothetical protein
MSVSESQSPEKVCVMSRVTRLPSLEVPYLTGIEGAPQAPKNTLNTLNT